MFIFEKMSPTYPGLFVSQLFFQVKMEFFLRGGVSSSKLTINDVKATIIFWFASEVLCVYFQFHDTESSKDTYLKVNINKIDNFDSFIRDIIK